MTTVLTLHEGNREASFTEHPIEVARRALLAAAEIETDRWASTIRMFANALPNRTGAIRVRPAHERARDKPDRKKEWQERNAAADRLLRAKRNQWAHTSPEARQAKLLAALGDDHLTVSEISDRLNQLLGTVTMVREWDGSEYTTGAVQSSTVRGLLGHLAADGHVGRELEEFKGKPRYRWSRTTEGEAQPPRLTQEG